MPELSLSCGSPGPGPAGSPLNARPDEGQPVSEREPRAHHRGRQRIIRTAGRQVLREPVREAQARIQKQGSGRRQHQFVVGSPLSEAYAEAVAEQLGLDPQIVELGRRRCLNVAQQLLVLHECGGWSPAMNLEGIDEKRRVGPWQRPGEVDGQRGRRQTVGSGAGA